MNKDKFWRIIDEVNAKVSPNDQKAILKATEEELMKLGSSEIALWKNYMLYYRDLADRNDLWAACAATKSHSTDDGFLDFRVWLISRGHDVYIAALHDPDSLADIDFTVGSADFESYSYVSANPYAMKAAQESIGKVAVEEKFDKWLKENKDNLYEGFMKYPQSENDLWESIKDIFLRKLSQEYDVYKEVKSHPLSPKAKKDIEKEISLKPDVKLFQSDDDLQKLVPRLYEKYDSIRFGIPNFEKEIRQIEFAQQLSTRKECSMTVKDFLSEHLSDEVNLMTPEGFLQLHPDDIRSIILWNTLSENLATQLKDMKITRNELIHEVTCYEVCVDGRWNVLSRHDPELELEQREIAEKKARLTSDMPKCANMLFDLETKLGGNSGEFGEWLRIVYELNQKFNQAPAEVAAEICDAFQWVIEHYGEEPAKKLYDWQGDITPSEIPAACCYLHFGGNVEEIEPLASIGFFVEKEKISQEHMEKAVAYMNTGGTVESIWEHMLSDDETIEQSALEPNFIL